MVVRDGQQSKKNAEDTILAHSQDGQMDVSCVYFKRAGKPYAELVKSSTCT